MNRTGLTAAPTIETERLVLRAHRPDDFDPYHELWTDLDIVRHISGRPSSREETWSRLLRAIGHWQVMGFGFWAAVEKASGRLIGELGVADFRRELTPSMDDAGEAGWLIAPSAQGQGLATEGIRAALAWSDQRLGFPRLFCMIAPENAPSVRVAVKSGFRELAVTPYRDAPTLIMERRPGEGLTAAADRPAG